MLRSLYVLAIYIAFIVLGASAPFVFTLGYVWVDAFGPQNITYYIMHDIPVSMVMAVCAIGGYVLLDRKSPPPLNFFVVMTVCFALWCTLSTAFWAVAPVSAWTKWDWAFKSVIFSTFLPFVFRSRVQIESFFQIYIFSVLSQFLPIGAKTIISGGGYGIALGLMGGNSGLAEGSTLATVCLMLVPIILYLRQHTIILKKSWMTDLLYAGVIAGAISCAFGTYERTALVAFAVMALGVWWRSRYKISGAAIGLCVLVVLGSFAADKWVDRMSTTVTYKQDSSALGRVLVWKWTLGFAMEHPFGGGYDAFRIDRIVYPGTDDDPTPVVEHGKAFHSIYFEMLGEQGWPGLAVFLTIIFAALMSLRQVARKTRRIPELLWARDLAHALQTSLLTFCAGGAFVGMGFQPVLWYMLGMSACLALHVRHCEKAGMPKPAAAAALAGGGPLGSFARL